MQKKNEIACSDEINKFLSDFPYEKNYGGAIFIHETIWPDVFDRLTNVWPYEIKFWNYELLIGNNCYKMVLLWIPNLETMIRSNLHKIVSESKYSFPWKSNVSIYTPVANFYLVDQFVQEHNLEMSVKRSYIDTSKFCIDQSIKVVEFHEGINKNQVLDAFRRKLDENCYQLPISYFATRAFKYLRPSFLSHLNQPLNNRAAIFTHLTLQIKYDRERYEIYNIFDIISMALAFYDLIVAEDYRHFDQLINDKIRKSKCLSHSVNGTMFNLNKYHSSVGILGYSEEVYQYLISKFHRQFNSVNIFSKGKGIFKIKPKQIKNIDHLLETSCFYTKLKIEFSSLNKHNSYVIRKILTHMDLPIKPTLTFVTEKPLEITYMDDTINWFGHFPHRDFKFEHSNDHYFIENLLNWMKLTIGSRWDNFDLRFIKTPIRCPLVLRGLTVNMIIIKEITVSCQLLRALQMVTYDKIKLSKCYLENDPEIFLLLDALGGDCYFQINITEHTIDNLLQALQIILSNPDRNEFRFQNYITIYHLKSSFEFIDLSRFTFSINEAGNQIETCDMYTNEMVNLYDYFYKLDQNMEYDYTS